MNISSPCLEVFERNRVRKRKVLQVEGGITQVSLENAQLLFKQYGVPQEVELINKNSEYDVLVSWCNPSYTHLFTGFSWGYCGEGPRGLDILLDACYSTHPRLSMKKASAVSVPEGERMTMFKK